MTRDILVALVDMIYIYKDRKVKIAFLIRIEQSSFLLNHTKI